MNSATHKPSESPDLRMQRLESFRQLLEGSASLLQDAREHLRNAENSLNEDDSRANELSNLQEECSRLRSEVSSLSTEKLRLEEQLCAAGEAARLNAAGLEGRIHTLQVELDELRNALLEERERRSRALSLISPLNTRHAC